MNSAVKRIINKDIKELNKLNLRAHISKSENHLLTLYKI